MQPRPTAETSRPLPSVRFCIFSSDIGASNLLPPGDVTMTCFRRNGLAAFVLVGSAACSNAGGPGPGATAIASNGGDNQVAPAASSLPTALSVRVMDQAGFGVP